MNDNSGHRKIVRKPEWLRVPVIGGTKFEHVDHLVKGLGLNTVCREANCPNRGECFNRGTATFLILGSKCTRNCRFCDIEIGRPAPPDAGEPARTAEAARLLDLKYVVVTSVTRDDLADGGANHFAATVAEIRKVLPEAGIELLTPDFKGSSEAARVIIRSCPDVFNHNVETVPRLYSKVRPAAKYDCSLTLLRQVHNESDIRTKSGLMLGLGERREELVTVFADLAEVGVSILTMGQYLSPSSNHLPVERYVLPDEFSDLKRLALEAGISQVASGPLVRSSYRADELLP
ncbi:MAG: lipoyl synthase [candidate division Zixibacteria bacterium]|nr:lipoyl synthase [candidate division Zixibacteria bacterium]